MRSILLHIGVAALWPAVIKLYCRKSIQNALYVYILFIPQIQHQGTLEI